MLPALLKLVKKKINTNKIIDSVKNKSENSIPYESKEKLPDAQLGLILGITSFGLVLIYIGFAVAGIYLGFLGLFFFYGSNCRNSFQQPCN